MVMLHCRENNKYRLSCALYNMGYIQLKGIASDIKSKLTSTRGIPIRQIEKYSSSSMNIVNDDNIQEYVEASSRGQGDDYAEYLDEDDSVSQSTVEATEGIDVGNSMTEGEIRDKIEREINNIYTKGSIERVANQLEEDINQAIRDNNLQNQIPSGVVRSVGRLTDIMKKIVNYAEGTVFFLGVAGSMLISEIGRFAMGAGMLIVLFTPILIGVSIVEGNPMIGLKVTAVVSAIILGGAAAHSGFDAVAKSLDNLYMERKGL